VLNDVRLDWVGESEEKAREEGEREKESGKLTRTPENKGDKQSQ